MALYGHWVTLGTVLGKYAEMDGKAGAVQVLDILGQVQEQLASVPRKGSQVSTRNRYAADGLGEYADLPRYVFGANKVRQTAGGPVGINMYSKKVPGGRGRVEIAVGDTGGGMGESKADPLVLRRGASPDRAY